MPQSLLDFAVSFTPETPNFGTFGAWSRARPFGEFLSMYMHTSEIKIMKKNRFQGAEPP